jgi:hypothetical protein
VNRTVAVFMDGFTEGLTFEKGPPLAVDGTRNGDNKTARAAAVLAGLQLKSGGSIAQIQKAVVCHLRKELRWNG